MSGAGIMLMTGDVARGSLCSSNPVSALIEDLQFTLGEGPCIDAYHEERPVLEPDLADPDHARWMAFSPPAVDAGVRAVFGFPVQIGVIRLGALNLYSDRPGGAHPRPARRLARDGRRCRAGGARHAGRRDARDRGLRVGGRR